MIRLKLHRRKEARCCRICSVAAVTWWACLVLTRCFHKRLCNTVLAVVFAIDHPEPFNHSPGHLNRKTPLPPPVLIKYLLLPKESGHSHCISFAIAESGWSIVSTGVLFGFRCFTASLTKLMTQLSKAVVRAFSSKSGIIIFGGIKPMLETGFSHEIYSTCDGLSFQQCI